MRAEDARKKLNRTALKIRSDRDCACGCGERTYLYTRDRPDQGHVMGQPARFLPGHNNYLRTGERGKPGGLPEVIGRAEREAVREARRQGKEIKVEPVEMVDPEDVLWAPHDGPQTLFMDAEEFEVFFGGAAGGGKSDAAVMLPLKWVDKPGFTALILRKTFPELQELVDRSHAVYPELGGKWREAKKRWEFPSGALVEFGYFEFWKHHTRYQGRQFCLIIWDELGQCPEERFWTFLMSRCRSADPELPTLMRGTGNPGGAGHGWLKARFIELCGNDGSTVHTESATGLRRRFIPSRLADNPALDLGDPGYRRRLESLPEIMRLQLLEGDWGASSGVGLHELSPSVHICQPHVLDNNWWYFGALDWGFHHPAWFGLFAVGQAGRIRMVDSVEMWRKQPHEMAERIGEFLDRVGDEQGYEIDVRYIVAGRECWSDIKARGENTPTIAEQFVDHGLALTKANQARIAGLNNMRRYVTRIGPLGEEVEPLFQLFDTPSNREGFRCLTSMVSDPKDPEDVLKVDADEYGSGGDDFYDMCRYGLASRPMVRMKQERRQQKVENYDEGWSRHLKKLKKDRKELEKRLGGRQRLLDDWLRSGGGY
jgi:hypothetical protein